LLNLFFLGRKSKKRGGYWGGKNVFPYLTGCEKTDQRGGKGEQKGSTRAGAAKSSTQGVAPGKKYETKKRKGGPTDWLTRKEKGPNSYTEKKREAPGFVPGKGKENLPPQERKRHGITIPTGKKGISGRRESTFYVQKKKQSST